MESTPATNDIPRPAQADLDEVSVHIRKQLGKGFALDLALAFSPGITIVFGPSGAGKTTLLDCIAGLTRPDAGRIAIAERVFFDSAAGINVPTRRRRVG